MNILYQSDDNYAPYMDVSIYSLLKNNKSVENISLFIIDDGISETNKEKISQEITSFGRDYMFLPAEDILGSDILKDYPQYGGTRKNTHSFLKLFLADVLPDGIDRILYIDCDTLVLGNIEPLFNYDLSGKIMGMALDCLVVKQKSMIGFSEDDRYYNSGVILIDMKKWAQCDCEKRVIEHSLHHTYGTVDQDLLNVEFKDEIERLPVRYNFQPFHLVYNNKTFFRFFPHKQGVYYYGSEIDEARNDIAIMHFFRYLGEQPWHKDNLHPCTKYFDEFLRESKFADYVKKPSNKGGIFAVERFLYKILPHSVFLCMFNTFFDMKLKFDKRKN